MHLVLLQKLTHMLLSIYITICFDLSFLFVMIYAPHWQLNQTKNFFTSLDILGIVVKVCVLTK